MIKLNLPVIQQIQKPEVLSYLGLGREQLSHWSVCTGVEADIRPSMIDRMNEKQAYKAYIGYISKVVGTH